jgi:heme exporter protein C
MPAEMWLPLVLMILGFYTLFALLTVLKTRTIILQRERRTQWVRELVQTQASGMESKNGL